MIFTISTLRLTATLVGLFFAYFLGGDGGGVCVRLLCFFPPRGIFRQRKRKGMK